MLQALHRLRRSRFVSNVAVLASGTAAAQAISMGFSPLITRVYGPEAYGIQGVFMSLTTIMVTVAAMTYPIAIVLPRSDADAIGIAKLSMYIGVAISLFITIIFIYFGPHILSLLNAEEISVFLYLVPAFMLISVPERILQQWLTRKKAFKLTAKISVWQAFLVGVMKVGAGLVYPIALTLIVINTVSGLLHTAMLWFGLRKEHSAKPMRITPEEQRPSVWKLAKRYNDFPLLRAPQVLLNAVSQGLPVFLLASFSGAEAAGFYSICRVVLAMPTTLIGSSVLQVFYPRFNDAVHNGENARELLIKATLAMAALGFVPYAIIVAFGPVLFQFVFGPEWKTAGEYAQWLAVWLFFAFINRPAIAAIPVIKMQGMFLFYEITSVLMRVGTLYIGFALLHSELSAISAFSITGALLNASLVCYVIGFSQNAISAAKREQMA